MASNYDAIREANIREYGEGTRHLTFLGSLYSDRTHFVYELLQNAEDADAQSVNIALYRDRLEVFHDGKWFDEADVRGICGVGAGTKPEDFTKIGKFGIGFKSVYAYTKSPEIHCAEEHFGIEHYVRPYAIDPIEVSAPWTTRFVFPFDSSSTSNDTAFNEIAKRLKSLNIRTLLFLRKIAEIAWRIDGGETGVYIRDTENRESAHQVNVIGQVNDETEDEESWLVFERAIQAPNEASVGPVEAAFLRSPKRNKGGIREIVATQDSPLFVSFATEKDTNVGFLMQGPYKTTPARDNIPRDDQWNRYLLEQTAELVIDAIRNLKAMGLLSVAVLETMPIREETFPPNSMFRPVYDRVARALTEEEFMPTSDGGFVCLRDALLGRGDDIRNLLSSEQLSDLFGDTRKENDQSVEFHKLTWLSWLISQDRTPALRHYLMNDLDMEEVDPERFARRVDHRFLAEQTDEWLILLYKFLLRTPALWRGRRASASFRPEGLIRRKQFIRLDDGRQVSAFAEDGSVAVYLPHQGAHHLPTVKPTLVRDPEAAKFLSEIGIHEPDVITEVLERVLPLYEPDEVEMSDEDHLGHIDLIIQALQVDSLTRRRTLIKKLKRSVFLFGRNAGTGEESRLEPMGLYQKSPELSVFLEGNPEAWLLDEIYGEEKIEAFRELGLSGDLNDLIHRKQSDMTGHVTVHRLHSWHKRGLDGFDPECSVDHLEFALMSQNVKRSLFVWKNIARPLQRQIEGKVETSSRQTYENSKIVTTVSKMGALLRSNAWLPDINEEFHKPSELSLTDLPQEFDRDEGLAGQLGMKGSEFAVLAEKSEFDIPDFVLMKKLKDDPKMYEEIDRMVNRNSRKPPFPERPSADPTRRSGHATEDAKGAPRKEFETRLRNVRTSGPVGNKDTYLRGCYTNDEEQLVCQICEEEMPFRRRDDKYYFESVQLFNDLSGEHTAAHLALCPVCAAKYKEFVKRDADNTNALRSAIPSLDGLEVEIELGQTVGHIRFVQKHLIDVQQILVEEA